MGNPVVAPPEGVAADYLRCILLPPSGRGHCQRRRLGLIAPVRMERLESVADAEDGLEIFPAVGAEFCAQPPNVDIQCPRSDLIAVWICKARLMFSLGRRQ